MLIDTLQRTQLDAFRELLDSVRQSATPTFDHRPANNFSRCKSVFSGRADESVEGFIDAIESYRDAANVPDDVAVKGISMLLTHTAATWWQGIKHQVSTWEDVISNLRSAFGDRRPPHRIYVDLFADGQQPMEKTDLFVARARALLAKLPRGDLCEKVELDMIYGLLHHKIRKRLRREEITSFNVLLQKARSIEDSTKEAHTSNAVAETSKGAAAAARARLEPPRPATQRVPTAAVEVSPRQRSSGDNADATPTAEKPEKRRYCVYCKSYGHTRDQCRKLLLKQTANDSNDNVVSKVNNIKCYGCGASGVIRSNCSKCSSNFSAVDFIQIPRTRSRGTTTAETSAVGKPSAQVSNLASLPMVFTGAVPDLFLSSSVHTERPNYVNSSLHTAQISLVSCNNVSTPPVNNNFARKCNVNSSHKRVDKQIVSNLPRSDDTPLFTYLSRPVKQGECFNRTHVPSELKSVSPREFCVNQCVVNNRHKWKTKLSRQCPSRGPLPTRATMIFSGQNQEFDNKSRVTKNFSGHKLEIYAPVKGTTNFNCDSFVTLSSVTSSQNGNARRPILGIEILGIRGRGLIDTAAKRTVASSSLYALLQQHNQPFVSSSMRVKLADGSMQTRQMLTTTLDVKLLPCKMILTEFVVFPDAQDNDTLLGVDFLVAAGLAIDFDTST
ncbi:uncharacterized protein LOC114251642 [Bombyx mandarina]|uniref:Uncharacterized protein LOC114251642 n=1 Tax=Bombyx mandarina TaxID=7092 RepID=A0A6J2KHF8_BOMMA|nr:uncharacterized protein LOC114251642 [Bombyx mandarina]